MKLWSEEEQDERMRKAKLMFNFALELCLLQSRNGSGFVLENPVAASSWQLPLVQQGLAEWPGTQFVSFDQCRLGLLSPLGGPIKKRTRFLTNVPSVVHHFNQMQCTCVRPHTRVQGSESGQRLSTWSQFYPEGMCDLLVQDSEEA